jgi:hypothetical protein
VITEDGEAARIVRSGNAGLVAPANDPARIAAALWQLVAGTCAAAPAAAVDGFAHPALAVRMAEQVELAIGHHGGATSDAIFARHRNFPVGMGSDNDDGSRREISGGNPGLQ